MQRDLFQLKILVPNYYPTTIPLCIQINPDSYKNRNIIVNLLVSSLTNAAPSMEYVVARSREREREVKCSNEVAMIECRYWYRRGYKYKYKY